VFFLHSAHANFTISIATSLTADDNDAYKSHDQYATSHTASLLIIIIISRQYALHHTASLLIIIIISRSNAPSHTHYRTLTAALATPSSTRNTTTGAYTTPDDTVYSDDTTWLSYKETFDNNHRHFSISWPEAGSGEQTSADDDATVAADVDDDVENDEKDNNNGDADDDYDASLSPSLSKPNRRVLSVHTGTGSTVCIVGHTFSRTYSHTIVTFHLISLIL
jgi:hypothetical protein